MLPPTDMRRPVLYIFSAAWHILAIVLGLCDITSLVVIYTSLMMNKKEIVLYV